MAYPQVSTTHYDEVKLMIDRFSKINDPLVFNENTSLAIVTAKNEKLGVTVKAQNEAAANLDTCTESYWQSDDELTKAVSSFRIQVGERYGKESDEYVWAGGVRPSEVRAKAAMTREAKKKKE